MCVVAVWIWFVGGRMGALSRWGWNALSRVGVDLVSDDFLTAIPSTD